MEVAHKTSGEIKTNKDQPLYENIKGVVKISDKLNLTNNQRYWFRWFAAEFVKTKQFSKVDTIHLQQAAFWLDARCAAYGIINTENAKGQLKGMVQKFKSGATNITGWMSVVKDADKALDNISAHFGLSFKDRNKLGESKKVDDKQLSMFEKWENRKQTAE